MTRDGEEVCVPNGVSPVGGSQMTKFEYQNKTCVAVTRGHRIWIEDGAGEILMVYSSVETEEQAVQLFKDSCPVCHGSGMVDEARECSSCW